MHACSRVQARRLIDSGTAAAPSYSSLFRKAAVQIALGPQHDGDAVRVLPQDAWRLDYSIIGLASSLSTAHLLWIWQRAT